MQQVRKGSVISESQYGMTIVSKIVTEIVRNWRTTRIQS